MVASEQGSRRAAPAAGRADQDDRGIERRPGAPSPSCWRRSAARSGALRPEQPGQRTWRPAGRRPSQQRRPAPRPRRRPAQVRGASRATGILVDQHHDVGRAPPAAPRRRSSRSPRPTGRTCFMPDVGSPRARRQSASSDRLRSRRQASGIRRGETQLAGSLVDPGQRLDVGHDRHARRPGAWSCRPGRTRPPGSSVLDEARVRGAARGARARA